MDGKLDVLSEELLYKKTPQELTGLLYDSCIEKIEKAIIFIKNKEYTDANQTLQDCNDILYRLGAGINYEAGIIADQLEAIYDYIARGLIDANVKKDVEKLEEILLLLTTINDAWNQALVKGVDKQNRAVRKKILSYEQDYGNPYSSVDRKD